MTRKTRLTAKVAWKLSGAWKSPLTYRGISTFSASDWNDISMSVSKWNDCASSKVAPADSRSSGAEADGRAVVGVGSGVAVAAVSGVAVAVGSATCGAVS